MTAHPTTFPSQPAAPKYISRERGRGGRKIRQLFDHLVILHVYVTLAGKIPNEISHFRKKKAGLVQVRGAGLD